MNSVILFFFLGENANNQINKTIYEITRKTLFYFQNENNSFFKTTAKKTKRIFSKTQNLFLNFHL